MALTTQEREALPSRSEIGVTLALLFHDMGWMSMRPEIAMPAMVVGLSLQLYTTIAACRHRGSHLANQTGLLFWLIGSIVWTMGELLWDDDKPAGFLSQIQFFIEIDPKRYGLVMAISVAIMFATCFSFLTYYVIRWARKRQSTVVVDEAYVCLPCVPLRVYFELFSLPWILMDSWWAYINLRVIQGNFTIGLNVLPIPICGFFALFIEFDTVRRQCVNKHYVEAGGSLAELLWMTGNILWAVQDAYTDGDGWMPMWYIALGMFIAGIVVSISVICTVAYAKCKASGSVLSGAPAISTPDLEAVPERVTEGSFRLCGQPLITPTCHDPLPLIASDVDADVSAVKKPKRKSTSRTRPVSRARLTRGVAAIPARIGAVEQVEFLQGAANVALREQSRLEGDEAPMGSVLLFDLGEVHRRLVAWRTHVDSRVRPSYKLRDGTDEKVIQLLGREQCGFECTTAAELAFATSLLGVSALGDADLAFASGHMSRADLAYARKSEVSYVHVEDAADLHRVAKEWPAAHVLLGLAIEHADADIADQPLLLKFGVPRDGWAAFLAEAVRLGLTVAGVALRAGPGFTSPNRNLSRLFADVHEALALGAAVGFSMSVVSLDGDLLNVHGPDADFERAAVALNEQLALWLPAAEFGSLRVVATLGRFFLQGATSLLTRVVAKEQWTPPWLGGHAADTLGCDDGFALKYLVTDVRCSVFGQPVGEFAECVRKSVANDTDVPLPVPLSLGESSRVERPQRRSCFVGSAHDNVDVILQDAVLPELDVGDWLLWCDHFNVVQAFGRVGCHALGLHASSMGTDPATECSDDRAQQLRIWYYFEDGHLP